MNCFKDKNGHQWTLDLNVGSAAKVKAETEIDLLNAVVFDENKGTDTSLLEKVYNDPYLLVSVLYSLCRKQCDNLQMTGEAFAECFDCDTIITATDALMKEIIDFSQPAKKMILRLLYKKTRDFREKAESKVKELVENQKFNEEIDGQLNSLLTNLPE